MHPDKDNPIWREWLLDTRDGVLRAFREFLRTPTLMVTGFLLLALGLYVLDHADLAWIDPLREVLKKRLFVDSSTTSDFLGAIAGGIISVTSITISLLLLTVQQGASSMTSAVLDQFLRRTRNQVYFGYFIGLALYCLVVLSTVHKDSNAVLSATAGLVLTLIALYLLIMLLYSTVHQMRPTVIVAAIVDRTVVARDQQRTLLHRTRRRQQLDANLGTTRIDAGRSGYLVRIHLDALEEGIEALEGFEIVLKLQIGSFVAHNDPMAEVRGSDPAVRERVAKVVRKALVIERHRDIEGDPGQGIGQIGRIAWVTISTAKSSTGPAAHAIRGLRDLLSRWCDEPAEDPEVRVLPLVYEDTVPVDLVDALESAVVASSESRQHQSFAEVLRAFSTTADRLRPTQKMAVAAMIERSIASIGEHVLTRELRAALIDAASTLAACGRPAAAARVYTTRDRLGRCLNEMPL